MKSIEDEPRTANASPPSPFPLLPSPFSLPPSLWAILALALGLRLLAAWSAGLVFDERAHWALAETIDFRPGHLHLVSRTLDHPLLSIYVLRVGSLLFGTSDFALRLPYVLIGTATLVPVYCLGKRLLSPRAGLWAAALLAVDQFHVSWSRVFMPEVVMLLLVSLAILQFLRTLDRGSTADFTILGALLGLAYLAKEPGVLLIPALWLYLLSSPADRLVLRSPRWYLAHVVFLLVVAPDIVWNAWQWNESYMARDAAMAAGSWQFSLKPVSLYLGEILQAVLGPHVLGDDYLDGNLSVCYWPAGLLYLVALAAVTCRAATPAARLLATVFLFTFGVFLVLPGGNRHEPFWWASISLIPAVTCAGWLLAKSSSILRVESSAAPDSESQATPPDSESRVTAARLVRFAPAVLLIFLAVHEAPVARRPGMTEPRATVDEFAGDFIHKGDEAMKRGDLREAESRFIYALNIGGPRAAAYCGLARVALGRDQPEKADRLMEECLALDPECPDALELRKRIRQTRGNL